MITTASPISLFRWDIITYTNFPKPIKNIRAYHRQSINNQKNSDTNTLLNSLKPFLPNYKKEKLETLIKISTIITALDLFENKKILGLTLNSNLILIIILILIIL